MSSVIEVKYPRHISECSPIMVTKWLHMAPLWKEAQSNLSGMLDFHVQVVSVFTGLKVNEIKRAAVDDVICYIEEGMEYCQKDDRGVVLNPNEKREALFKERFPGDEFLNFFGFFLHEYESRRNAILALQVVRMEAQRIAIMKKVRQTASGLHGQESSSGWLRNLVGRLTKSQGSRT